jgi:hypothetical protein
MLQLLDDYDGSGAVRRRLVERFEAYLDAVLASKERGDRAAVAHAEAAVRADPAHRIRFNDAGIATVDTAQGCYQGGRFETPSLFELRTRALAARERAGQPQASVRLWAFDGAGPVTDIGALQATAAPRSLFQVASQFNCLESPGRYVTDVAEYLHDPTQGPRASISAFPGTLVRHYAAPRPDGSRFVQSTKGPQLNLLADVCDPGVARVESGYLRSSDIAAPRAFARALGDRFDSVRVGVHDDVEVALGYDWDGSVEGAPHRTIAQVFTSTVAAGMYGVLDVDDPSFATICRQLQRAAYLGTLLAAAALGKDRVALTLIGGGAFANPIQVIWDAVVWAVDQVRPVVHRDLTVVVNGRTLRGLIPPDTLLSALHARGGALLRFDRSGARIVEGCSSW